jgi:hypothetical protein
MENCSSTSNYRIIKVSPCVAKALSRVSINPIQSINDLIVFFFEIFILSIDDCIIMRIAIL